MNNESSVSMTSEDCFNLGKADSWNSYPKQPPEHDSLAASLYDLGYSEGKIEHSPTAINQLNLGGNGTKI